MGLPIMSVIFVAMAREMIRRSERGTVGMIIKEASIPSTNPTIVYTEDDIPSSLSEANKEQIKLALKGNDTAPSKIVVYAIKTADEDYTEALEYFELKKVTWLCCPTVDTDNQTDAVVAWVKKQRASRNRVKAVLPSKSEGTAPDCEGIINYATDSVTVGSKTYTAESYCARIAGLLAGTSYKKSATYAILDEITECEKLDKDSLDEAVNAGKFVVFNDGEKIKVARAVNSLSTVKDGKADAWKKIRVVETMDMMHDDLVLLTEDNYIGKYPNTYSNKCLLIAAITDYLKELARNGLIEDYAIGLDADKIKDYIVENKGVGRDEAEAMAEEELKKQYTDDKVFLKASVTLVDVMEDISLEITV